MVGQAEDRSVLDAVRAAKQPQGVSPADQTVVCWVSGGSPGAAGVHLPDGFEAGALVELVVEGDGGVDQ